MTPASTPTPDLSMTGQVTIRVPTAVGIDRFVAQDIQSAISGTAWIQNSRADAPTEDTSVDYLSFGLMVSNPTAFNWQAGVEKEVFSFTNGGTCLGAVELLEDLDPFNATPNSVGTRPGNQFTNLAGDLPVTIITGQTWKAQQTV